MKMYKLDPNPKKYRSSVPCPLSRTEHFRQYINHRKTQIALDARKKYRRKRLNPWVAILVMLAYQYAFIGVCMLLSKLGF